jgi:hypothetical protein
VKPAAPASANPDPFGAFPINANASPVAPAFAQNRTQTTGAQGSSSAPQKGGSATFDSLVNLDSLALSGKKDDGKPMGAAASSGGQQRVPMNAMKAPAGGAPQQQQQGFGTSASRNNDPFSF